MTSFLDYYKIILEKVSFDPMLLRKEYQKAKRNLCTDETKELNKWLQSRGFAIGVNEHARMNVNPEHFRQNVHS